jgi:hypothetical protein
MANEALSLAYLTPFGEQVFRQKQCLLKNIQSPRKDVVVRPLIQPTERSSPVVGLLCIQQKSEADGTRYAIVEPEGRWEKASEDRMQFAGDSQE